MPDDGPEPVETNDPPPAVVNKTKVALRADMTIDEEPVAIEGVIGGSFFLQLEKPARLGTPISFAYWLKDTYGVDNLEVMLPAGFADSADFKSQYRQYRVETNANSRKQFEDKIADHLKARGIPKQLHTVLTSAFLAELTITDLLIDIKEGEDGKDGSRKMMFGLSMGFPKPLPLIPNVDVNKLSILVMNAPEKDFTFPARVQLPAPTPIARATGAIEFSAQPTAGGTITLGDDTWSFVAKTATPKGRQVKLGDALDKTLVELAKQLNAYGGGDTGKCRYVANIDADPKRLEIAFKSLGSVGNAFELAADDKSKGTPSAASLKGGAGQPLATYATGAIRFTGVPEAGSKITVGGVDCEFVAGEPADGKVQAKAGTSAAEAATNLAEALAKVKADPVALCRYQAREVTVLVTFKETGEDGNGFKIAAGAKSNAKVSGPTLTGGA